VSIFEKTPLNELFSIQEHRSPPPPSPKPLLLFD